MTNDPRCIVFRQWTPDAPREYYLGTGRWSDVLDDAKRFDPRTASALCENIGTRYQGQVLFMQVPQ